MKRLKRKDDSRCQKKEEREKNTILAAFYTKKKIFS